MARPVDTLKIGALNRQFYDRAHFTALEFGGYMAIVNTGESLRHRFATDLGILVLDYCIDNQVGRINGFTASQNGSGGSDAT